MTIENQHTFGVNESESLNELERMSLTLIFFSPSLFVFGISEAWWNLRRSDDIEGEVLALQKSKETNC